MQHRLAVIADEVDGGRLDAIRRKEAHHGLGVELRQRALELGKTARPLRARPHSPRLGEASAQAHPDLGRIGIAGGGSVAQRAVAVGLDEGDVDAVHRRSAHQADSALLLAHRALPVHVRRHHPRGAESYRGHARSSMPNLKSDFLRILTERGFLHQCSDEAGLDALSLKGEIVAYVGYDCTAPSLHVGSLISIMMLHWLQKCGGKPIVLMGGGTTRVGDPSGKDETRKILSLDDIEANKAGMAAGLRQVPAIRLGQDRRGDGRQRRVAQPSQLHRFPARRGAAFLRQPHADHGQCQAPLGPRAGALLHRVQLHAAAGLRLRGAGAPLWLQPADGRLRPVGQHRHRHRSRPAHGARASALRAHLPAA